MTNQEKINLLRKLLDKSESVTVESSGDPVFKQWKNLVERTFIKIFGKNSPEFEHFSELRFSYPVFVVTATSDYSSDHLRCFRQDFQILTTSINEYIEELEEELSPVISGNTPVNILGLDKIFISHSSLDSGIVEEIIELLEAIGIESHQIFCSSFEGYGIELGDNYLEALKNELSSNSLVLFVLSENFYASPACLCEMGAAWILSKEHIPLIVPPLSYSDVKGVVPLTQGMMLNDEMKLNSFKDKIEKSFNIKGNGSFSTWERKRDRVCKRLKEFISE